MMPDGKEREKIEHNYGFSSQTIEEYSAVLENRLEALGGDEDDQGKGMNQAAEEDDFETDFIGGRDLRSDLKDLDAQVGDLESLNLFGVDMSAENIMRNVDKRKKGTTKKEVQ